MKDTPLTPDELVHYSRHLTLPQIGVSGQARLKNSSVLIVGLGGLGSPLALYLAAAGVGRLGLVEFDELDATNLHRQVLYGQSGVGQSKLELAVARLRDLNPHVRLEPHAERLSAKNARSLVKGYDLVADGADNFTTRYLVNDACVLEGKPLVSASISAFEGQLSVFHHAGGPCYRCLYPSPPPPGSIPSCAEAGVLGVLPGVLGSLQAAEALKLLLGIGQSASGRLVVYDALSLELSSFRFARNPDCAICGDTSSAIAARAATGAPELGDFHAVCAIPPAETADISPRELRARLAAGDVLLIDVRESYERDICRIEPSAHHPLAELQARGLDGIATGKNLVVMCRSGARSRSAVEMLARHGFRNVQNLSGGILGWIAEVDPSLKRY